MFHVKNMLCIWAAHTVGKDCEEPGDAGRRLSAETSSDAMREVQAAETLKKDPVGKP